MMYGVKKFSLVSAAFGLTMLVACGDEGTTKSTEQAGISMLEAGQSMPECDSEGTGTMVYAADSATVYYCADSKWQTLNSKDGTDGKDGTGCTVGDPSTDKDGNTVVAMTCGETSSTLTIAKGGKGEAGASCSIGDPTTDKEGNTVVAVTCGETKKTLTIAKGGKGDIGTGCSVGDPSTDKDGNTVVAVTCGETKETLTIAKGDKGEAAIGCKAEDMGNGKVVVTCGEGDSKIEQTLYKATCGAEGYDPAEVFCFENETYDFCNAQIYNPAEVFCFKDKTYDLCNGLAYNPEEAFCFEGKIYDRCNGLDYNPKEASCYEGEIYSCDNKPYNPAEQYCLTLKDENGEEKKTIEELLIDNRDENNVQAYKTVKIGSQTWMAENLNYSGVQSWCGGGGGTTEGDCSVYGRLYTWAVAIGKADCGSESDCENSNEGVQGICPKGWHLPSYDELLTLHEIVRGFAGTKLKSSSGWDDGGNGKDSFGFAVLPAGYRSYDGNFRNVGNNAGFWSSSEENSGNAGVWVFYGVSVSMQYILGSKNNGESVRCLRD